MTLLTWNHFTKLYGDIFSCFKEKNNPFPITYDSIEINDSLSQIFKLKRIITFETKNSIIDYQDIDLLVVNGSKK